MLSRAILVSIFLVFSVQCCIYERNVDASFQYGQGVSGVTPYFWWRVAPECGSSDDFDRQSPIDITETIYDSSLNELTVDYPGSVTGKCFNNGHTAECAEWAEDVQPKISGGPFGEDTYTLNNFHFHWGLSDYGSEHLVGGQSYAAELHLTHFNDKYNRDDSLNHVDGVSVVSVLLSVGEPNPAFDLVFETLANVETPEDGEFEITGLQLRDLLPNNLNYYYYAGSSTTPPCRTAVQWLVLERTMELSLGQLQLLQNLAYEDSGDSVTVGPNNRPLQSRNSREILRNFQLNIELATESAEVIYESCSSAKILVPGLFLFSLLFLGF